MYDDDRQVVELLAKRVPLSRSVELRGMPREVVLALWRGVEFVHISVESIRGLPPGGLSAILAGWRLQEAARVATTLRERRGFARASC